MKYLKVSEICETLKSSLPTTKFNIYGETSNVKLSNGHLYFVIKEKGYLLNCIIWKSVLGNIKISNGDQLKLVGSLNFYDPSGSVSFVVSKINDICGSGQLYLEYEKLKEEYQNKNYFNRKRVVKNIIENICLITSKESAAIQDFLYVINSSRQKININIIDVNVQGVNCDKSVSDSLNSIIKKYDLIVITRGGGSFEDLFRFSQPLVLESVYNSENITLSAIGHQVDITLCDMVADISCPTPSLAGEYIVNHNLKIINDLEDKLNYQKLILLNRLNDYDKILINQENKLISFIKQMEDKLNEIKLSIQKRIDNYELELEKLKNRLDSDNNIRIINDDSIIKTLKDFNNCENNVFKLAFPDGDVKVIIQKVVKGK